MKFLKLKLKKIIGIAELDENQNIDEVLKYYNYVNQSKIENIIQICKGSELTEELAEEFVKVGKEGFECYDYKNNNWGSFGFSPIQSFISAIEAAGYHWKINPMLKVDGYSYVDLRCPIKYEHKFNQAESRTFDPEKTLIFKIIEK